MQPPLSDLLIRLDTFIRVGLKEFANSSHHSARTSARVNQALLSLREVLYQPHSPERELSIFSRLYFLHEMIWGHDPRAQTPSQKAIRPGLRQEAKILYQHWLQRLATQLRSGPEADLRPFTNAFLAVATPPIGPKPDPRYPAPTSLADALQNPEKFSKGS